MLVASGQVLDDLDILHRDQPDGSFAITIPAPPDGLLVLQEVSANADTQSLNVDKTAVRRSNYIETAIMDMEGGYLWMLYRSNQAQGQFQLPAYFRYFVFYDEAQALDGAKRLYDTGYYAPSGEWIVKPVVDTYNYEDVRFSKGWNPYNLKTFATSDTPDTLFREYAIATVEPAGMGWHVYDRPDLEPAD